MKKQEVNNQINNNKNNSNLNQHDIRIIMLNGNTQKHVISSLIVNSLYKIPDMEQNNDAHKTNSLIKDQHKFEQISQAK